MLEKSVIRQFRIIGRDMFLRGLVGSHAGNMSARIEDTIYITRTGSMLGHLTERDVIEVHLDKDDENVPRASSELVVHRAIYRNTSALSVIHAHPPYATLLSMVKDAIVPVDSEGSHFFSRVPVVSPKQTIGSAEGARLVSQALKNVNIVLMRGHGSFARGDTLEKAYMFTSSLESSAFFLHHLGALGKMGVTS